MVNLLSGKVSSYLYNNKFIFWIYVLVTIIVSLAKYYAGTNYIDGGAYSHINNYHIFKASFQHLISGKDLYTLHPADHFDLYKYSPAFAVFMGLFYWLPDVIGIIIWNMLNSITLFFSILQLNRISSKNKILLLLFILPELIISLQNSQSNGLMAALIIYAFNFLEKEKYFIATLFISLTVFIKLFGIFAFLLCLFYPQRIKSVLYAMVWFVFLALLPLLLIPFSQLINLYQSWLNMLGNDHSASVGVSVLGMLRSLNLFLKKELVLLVGLIILLLTAFKNFKVVFDQQKNLVLSSILIWIVIFNHKAESPTYIIAMCGAAIWYFSYVNNSILHIILLFSAFVFSSISPTDLFPKIVRQNIIIPYSLKALPLTLIWLAVSYELITIKNYGLKKGS